MTNESTDLMRMLDTEFHALAARDVVLAPEHLRDEIDTTGRRLYDGLNNAVQDRLYLLGDRPTEAGWRAFVTLIRFDAVYHGHFKCNKRKLVEYPRLWEYTKDLYAQPGVAATVRMDEIKRRYYTTHPEVDPTGIVPLGPDLELEAVRVGA